jgi:hypothetical protein
MTELTTPQADNTFLAGPTNGAPAVATFRVLDYRDVPWGTDPWNATNLYIGNAGSGIFNFTVKANNVVAIDSQRASNDASAPFFAARKSRGTWQAPSIVATGDMTGAFFFEGWNGSLVNNPDGFIPTTTITSIVTEPSPSITKLGGQLQFATTPNGSITPTLAATIDQDQSVILAGVLRLPNTNYSASTILLTDASKNVVSGVVGSGLSLTGGTLTATGATSTQGPPGIDGIDGEDGPPGPPGLRGATGATGPPGPGGASGVMMFLGADGEDGFDGSPGPAGAIGPAGPAGSAGATGPQGPIGSPGFDGTDGEDGVPGPSGVAGAAGAAGARGANGPPGMDGLDGDDGFPLPTIGDLSPLLDQAAGSAQGSVLYRGAQRWAALPPGSSGQFLQTSGAAANPSWASIPFSGSLVYQDGTVPGGNTIANTGAATAFASSYSIPAGSLTVGSVIRVKLYGVYSTALTPPTITLAIKVGSTTLLTTGAITAVNSLTNDGWWTEALMTVTAIGASGSMEAQGFSCFATAATAAQNVDMTNTAVVGSIDTTASLALTANVTWGTASASNTITLREMIVEVMAVGTPANGMVLLGEVIASGSASSIVVNVPTVGYRHLRIEYNGFASAIGQPLLHFNGDAGNNYANQFIQGFNGTASANGGVNQNGVQVGYIGTSAMLYPATSVIEVPYYSQSGVAKSVVATSFGMNTASLMVTITGSGSWTGTSPINSITLLAGGGSFTNGFKLSVYGII